MIGLVLLATAVTVGLTVWGCGKTTRPVAGPLDSIRPETRQNMQTIMNKVGQHYLVLGEKVDKGLFPDAATHADAIAALGTYLAPYRDPAVPQQYIALQAAFDESARELAVAARLMKAHEVTQLFDEMQRTCRNCHDVFHVPLRSPYGDLGWRNSQPQ